MADSTRALVEKQLGRVRRRLFLQVAVESLLLTVAVGLLASMLWFLVRPFAFDGSGTTVRWSVPGALLGLSTIGGLILAWMRRPSDIASSLALDERFGLKQRVTTFLTLPADAIDSLAGEALLHDVTAKLSRLEISGAFPLRVTLKQVLIPAGTFALAILACVFEPYLGNLFPGSRVIAAQENRPNIEAKVIQKQLDALKDKIEKRNQEDQIKSEELKEIEKEFEKLIKDPVDGKDPEKVREQLDKMRKLEDKMKERLDDLREKTEKIDRLKDQLKQLGIDKDKLSGKDGPAKDFEDALMKGDFDKAKTALEKLMKDLKNDKLTPDQKKEVAEQFKKLQDQMKKLMDNNDLMKQLKKDLKDGKITEEQFMKELDRFKDLQDLTDILGDAKDALEKGGGKEALEKLMKRFEEIELTEKEIRDLLRDQEEIEDAMRLLMRAMNGDEFGDGQGDGLGQGQFPGARRPIDPNDPNSKIRDERSRADNSAKGMQRVTGYARGGNFSKIPAKAVEGAFRQAQQNAPEAIERQRIPDDAAEMTREYFRKLGNQK
ncbi:MAG: hypothetical protein EXR98_14450 [Gemmataceae bacterium]|nr:hypothetical protein [Gemmataceae bacterium]